MVDLDGFKSINDRFGHVAGDMVIRDISEILRRSVRIFDVCTRFGGEEFAVMMPGGTAESAGAIAERIRQRVEAYQRSEPDLVGLRVTASIGVAVSPPGVTATGSDRARRPRALSREESGQEPRQHGALGRQRLRGLSGFPRSCRYGSTRHIARTIRGRLVPEEFHRVSAAPACIALANRETRRTIVFVTSSPRRDLNPPLPTVVVDPENAAGPPSVGFPSSAENSRSREFSISRVTSALGGMHPPLQVP